jgi:hypothetical protein
MIGVCLWQDGEIAQSGNHEELIGKTDGLYYELVQRQTGSSLNGAATPTSGEHEAETKTSVVRARAFSEETVVSTCATAVADVNVNDDGKSPKKKKVCHFAVCFGYSLDFL